MKNWMRLRQRAWRHANARGLSFLDRIRRVDALLVQKFGWTKVWAGPNVRVEQ